MVDIVIYILKMFIKMKSEFLAMNDIFDIVDKNKYLIDILKFNNYYFQIKYYSGAGLHWLYFKRLKLFFKIRR